MVSGFWEFIALFCIPGLCVFVCECVWRMGGRFTIKYNTIYGGGGSASLILVKFEPHGRVPWGGSLHPNKISGKLYIIAHPSDVVLPFVISIFPYPTMNLSPVQWYIKYRKYPPSNNNNWKFFQSFFVQSGK